MAGARTPRWRQFLHEAIPCLFNICPSGNFHWIWERMCYCGRHEHHGNWHGGLYDLKTKQEYQPCWLCDQRRKQ